MNFLIAYDIADPKRLREVAKHLESVGRRVQKSVFIYTGSRRDLEAIIGTAIQFIEPSLDRIQAWPIRTSTKACRIDAGNALPETGVALVMLGDEGKIIEALDNAHDDEPFLLDLI
jgi:CRISPR-associated protein Cas2